MAQKETIRLLHVTYGILFVITLTQALVIKNPGTYDYYNNHKCIRECQANALPMVCEYTFTVESYHTLSKACYNCPYNQTDCSRPHCVAADGVERSIMVVNRLMPGPSIQVCVLYIYIYLYSPFLQIIFS